MESELRKFFFDNWRGSRNFAAQTGARPSTVLKRESGVNPEQSRCCEPHATVRQHIGTTSGIRHYTAAGGTGRRPKPVGGESEDLPESKNADALPRAYSNAGLRGRAQSLIRPEIPAGNMGALRAARSGGCGNSICDMFHPRPCPPLRKEHNTFVRCHKHLRHF